MTALNECRSPQWNVTYGGRTLCLVSSVPGRVGSTSMSSRILPVWRLTSVPRVGGVEEQVDPQHARVRARVAQPRDAAARQRGARPRVAARDLQLRRVEQARAPSCRPRSPGTPSGSTAGSPRAGPAIRTPPTRDATRAARSLPRAAPRRSAGPRPGTPGRRSRPPRTAVGVYEPVDALVDARVVELGEAARHASSMLMSGSPSVVEEAPHHVRRAGGSAEGQWWRLVPVVRSGREPRVAGRRRRHRRAGVGPATGARPCAAAGRSTTPAAAAGSRRSPGPAGRPVRWSRRPGTTPARRPRGRPPHVRARREADGRSARGADARPAPGPIPGERAADEPARPSHGRGACRGRADGRSLRRPTRPSLSGRRSRPLPSRPCGQPPAGPRSEPGARSRRRAGCGRRAGGRGRRPPGGGRPRGRGGHACGPGCRLADDDPARRRTGDAAERIDAPAADARDGDDGRGHQAQGVARSGDDPRILGPGGARGGRAPRTRRRRARRASRAGPRRARPASRTRGRRAGRVPRTGGVRVRSASRACRRRVGARVRRTGRGLVRGASGARCRGVRRVPRTGLRPVRRRVGGRGPAGRAYAPRWSPTAAAPGPTAPAHVDARRCRDRTPDGRVR